MGGNRENLEMGAGTPPSVRGSIYKKKVVLDLGPDRRMVAGIRKEVLTPPTPPPFPPPKRAYPAQGGRRAKMETFLQQLFSATKSLGLTQKHPGSDPLG